MFKVLFEAHNYSKLVVYIFLNTLFLFAHTFIPEYKRTLQYEGFSIQTQYLGRSIGTANLKI
jgi:hypothetical protein